MSDVHTLDKRTQDKAYVHTIALLEDGTYEVSTFERQDTELVLTAMFTIPNDAHTLHYFLGVITSDPTFGSM